MQNENEVTLFVSHHSSKLEVAQAVEAALMKRGIKCWIAPRDVDPGEPFDKSVRNAIDTSSAILLLFCAQSEKSRHVKRELILGDTAGRPIIPLRLEKIDPGELAYHLADSQWIDWIDRRDGVIDRVAAQAKHYAGISDSGSATPEPTPASPDESITSPSSPRTKIPGSWIALAAIALLAAVLITWMITNRGQETQPLASDAEEPVEIAEMQAEEATDPNETINQAGEDGESSPPPMPRSLPMPTPLPNNPSPSAPPQQPAAAPPATPQPAPAQSASLQRVVQACAGVPTDTEYLICADPALGARAREMSGLIAEIRSRLASSTDRLRRFNRAQRDWFNTVKATCHSAACVAAEQDRWNANLRSRMATMN